MELNNITADDLKVLDCYEQLDLQQQVSQELLLDTLKNLAYKYSGYPYSMYCLESVEFVRDNRHVDFCRLLDVDQSEYKRIALVLYTLPRQESKAYWKQIKESVYRKKVEKKTKCGNNRHEMNELIKHNGLALTRKEWSEKLGINLKTLNTRIARGMSVDRVLTPGKLPNLKKIGGLACVSRNKKRRP